jgi:hypothetical protein
MEKRERIRSIGPAGVLATPCVHRRPDATREAPALIVVWINLQLAISLGGNSLGHGVEQRPERVSFPGKNPSQGAQGSVV